MNPKLSSLKGREGGRADGLCWLVGWLVVNGKLLDQLMGQRGLGERERERGGAGWAETSDHSSLLGIAHPGWD